MYFIFFYWSANFDFTVTINSLYKKVLLGHCALFRSRVDDVEKTSPKSERHKLRL